MTSVTTRHRSVSGKTNYRHRLKTIKNYDEIIRLCFSKHQSYMTAGLYLTKDPALSDVCLKCWDSRAVVKECPEAPKYQVQRTRQTLFGASVGREARDLLAPYRSRRLILDLGSKKKKRWRVFAKAFSSECQGLLWKDLDGKA